MPPGDSPFQPWYQEFTGAGVAVSLYAAAPHERLRLASEASKIGIRVHADVIMRQTADADGSRWLHTGVPPAQIDELGPLAHVDLHLIAIGTLDDELLLTARSILHPMIRAVPRSVALSAALLSALRPEISELRARGANILLEVGHHESPHIIEPHIGEIDGALVMLIETGTSQSARPDLLEKISVLVTSEGESFIVAVDGGVTRDIAAEAIERGAQLVVSGRALLARE